MSAISPQLKPRQWIAELDSDRFPVRQAAARELEQRGAQAEQALERAVQDGLSLEARRRAEDLLQTLRGNVSTEVLRTLRAIQTLETIGSPEARAVLRQLAGGAPAARETREAQRALERRALSRH